MHNGELSNCCAPACAGIYETPEGKYQEKDVVHSAPKFQPGDSVCVTGRCEIKSYKIKSVTIADGKYRYLIDDTYLHGFGWVYCDEEHLIVAPKYKLQEEVVVNLGDNLNHKRLKITAITSYNERWKYTLDSEGCTYCDIPESYLRPVPKYNNGQCVVSNFWPDKQVWIISDPVWDNSEKTYYYHISGKIEPVSESYVNEITDGVKTKYLFYDAKDKLFRILIDVDFDKLCKNRGTKIKRIESFEDYTLFKGLIDLQKDKDVFELLNKKINR